MHADAFSKLSNVQQLDKNTNINDKDSNNSNKMLIIMLILNLMQATKVQLKTEIVIKSQNLEHQVVSDPK